MSRFPWKRSSSSTKADAVKSALDMRTVFQTVEDNIICPLEEQDTPEGLVMIRLAEENEYLRDRLKALEKRVTRLEGNGGS